MSISLKNKLKKLMPTISIAGFSRPRFAQRGGEPTQATNFRERF
jgi:hypothetical protein